MHFYDSNNVQGTVCFTDCNDFLNDVQDMKEIHVYIWTSDKVMQIPVPINIH